MQGRLLEKKNLVENRQNLILSDLAIVITLSAKERTNTYVRMSFVIMLKFYESKNIQFWENKNMVENQQSEKLPLDVYEFKDFDGVYVVKICPISDDIAVRPRVTRPQGARTPQIHIFWGVQIFPVTRFY